MLKITWILSIVVLLNNSAQHGRAGPVDTTTSLPTTYIVSYVKQSSHQAAKQEKQQEHDAAIKEFDDNPQMRTALQKFFGRFVHNLESNFERLDESLRGNEELKDLRKIKNNNLKLIKNDKLTNLSKKENEILYDDETYDLYNEHPNTLDSGFGTNEQHESQINGSLWQRSKQSLQHVQHFVHRIRDGSLNHTAIENRNRTLLSGDMTGFDTNDTSPAIETEEEREMINVGSDLRILETLGSIGSKVLGFFSNFRQVFAASSAALSSSSSAGSS